MKEKMKKNEVVKDVIYDLIGAFLQAVGVHCFIEPCRIAPGGASGIALIINYISGFPIGMMVLLLNIPLLICSYLLLGKAMTIKTMKTVVIMSVVLDVCVAPYFPQYLGERLISSAFGGIFVGAGLALIFMRNSTSGGGDILAKLLQRKRPYMQTGYAIMLIDLVIIGCSVLVFRGIEAALYGIISMMCTTQTIDAILYGMNKGTMVTIVSPKNREIAEVIMEKLNRGVTFYKSMGGFSKKDGETLMCVTDRKQFYLVKEIVDAIDPGAFVIVSETKEVYGEGFRVS
ncbi:MAG: YitT family protein [Clostridium sp.]